MLLPAVTRPSRPRPVVFAVSLVLVWLLLAVLAVVLRRGPIENDLSRRASDAVRRAGAAHVAVTVAGTSVTLHGDFPSLAAAQAALRAARVHGVTSAQLGADARVGATPAGAAPTTAPASTGPASSAPPSTGPASADSAEGRPSEASAAGAPPAGAAGGDGDELAARAALAAATGGHPVTFAHGDATLTAPDRTALDRVAAVLRAGTLPVVVTGYADSTGPAAYNAALSSRRAAAAVGYLVDSGVPAGRLRAVGLGEGSPVADNRTAAGRAANRRVEVSVEPSS